MATTNSALIVPPPEPAHPATNDILPIKPPVEISGGLDWLWWTLGALALLGALAWWFAWRRRPAKTAAVPAVPPHIRARRKLQEALRWIADPRMFCIEVSDTIRVYLEERFELRAPERTTEEFLHDLQRTDKLSADQKQRVAEFLQHCDLVKFARFEPAESDLRELHDSAMRLVDETQYEPITIPPAGPEPSPGAVSPTAMATTMPPALPITTPAEPRDAPSAVPDAPARQGGDEEVNR